MATIDTKTKDPFSILDKMKWDESRFRLETVIHDDLRKASDALPSPLTPDGKYLLPKEKIGKALVGRLIRWPVADGYALYRVTSAKPLKVQHLHFGDGYSVYPETIRGLTIGDVANMVARDIKMKALFAKKG
jgi:hypothetical protein